MEQKKYKLTKYTAFFSNLVMASIFSMPPMLFVTFRQMYGISYTLLGSLVLINFCTQMIVDLVLTFFSKHFNVHKMIRIMPLITAVGLLTYAIVPMIVPQHAYLGLVIGTVIFSISAGLCEVLLSPLVAALPSDNPQRDMSLLHSLYAYGVLMVVIITTLFVKIFGGENWMYLAIFFAILPIIIFILFSISPMPPMQSGQEVKTEKSNSKKKFLALCGICIFLGSAAENSMTNWISGYVERALGLPKMVGDIFGMAMFAILLGLTRSWYAKYGKNISRVLLCGMIGASACYIITALSGSAVISLITCILMGAFTSMLWPGTLILMEEKLPGAGVTAYALMASAGDMGASVAPQMLGIVVDKVSVSGWAGELAQSLPMTTEQIGMKVGMLSAAIFPLIGIFVVVILRKKRP